MRSWRKARFSMKATTREWIEKAEADFLSATREYRARNRPNFDAACFFAQQCVEKYLKGRLSTKPAPGSARAARESPRGRGPAASSSSRRLSFWIGSPTSCRRRASTGTGITASLRRITRSGPPSRHSRSAISASGARPRLAGTRVTGTAPEAAVTPVTRPKSHAHMTPRGLPGPSSWRGWGRSFRWSARTAAATFG